MNVEAWTLLRPEWLLALPLFGWLAWRGAEHERLPGPWMSLVDPVLRSRVLASRSLAPRWPGLLAIGLAVLALAGPALRDQVPDIAWRADATRVLLVDLSPAMANGGVDRAPAKERLGAVLATILAALPEGDTALVVYADSPFVAVPPTRDLEIIARYLPELDPQVMPKAGDSPERALAFAADLLQRSGAARRDILWITAGASVPRELKLRALDGIGVQTVDLNTERTSELENFAAGAGWSYLRPGPGAAPLEAMAGALEPSGWQAVETRPVERYRDFGPWLLLAMLPLAAFSLSTRAGGLGMVAALMWCGGAPPPAQGADDVEGYLRWQAGDYAAAAEAFVDPHWRAVALHRAGRHAEAAATLHRLDDADAHYNRGVALARAGELAGALAAFEAALALRPGDGDARFNRDLLHELMSPPPAEQPSAGTLQSGPLARRTDTQREAALLAEQWLRRGGSDEPGLLQRRLAIEQRRRDGAGETR